MQSTHTMNDLFPDGIITIHKLAGKKLKNFRRICKVSDIPEELMSSGSVSVSGNIVTMMSREGASTRIYPFFMFWEKTNGTIYRYDVWSADIGKTNFIVDDATGYCYEKAPLLSAFIVGSGNDVPDSFCELENVHIQDGLCSVTSEWGEIRTFSTFIRRESPDVILINQGNNKAILMSLSEPEAMEYIIQSEGLDIGYMLEILKEN